MSLTIYQVKKKLKKNDSKKVFNLIKRENIYSILSNFSKKNINIFFDTVLSTNNFYLFLLKKNSKTIGYALFVKNEKFLINTFKNIKFLMLLDLLIKFKLLTLINLFLAFTKLDLILLERNKLKNNKFSINLNLLAIEKKFQSKSYGSFFVKKALRLIQKDFKYRTLTCEAPDARSLNFYINNLNFKVVGKKIRLLNNLFLLKKKIN